MSWAEIKHALNSSLGTNNFKPLDKMLEEIYNNYHIELSTTRIGEFDKEYIFKYDGRIGIYITARNSSANTVYSFAITYTINGISTEKYFKVNSNSTVTENIILDVNKDDVFSVGITNDSYDLVQDKWIGGTVVSGQSPII